MVRITDKSFVYTPSYDTDLRKKFRMIIEQRRKAELKRDKKINSVRSMVVPLTTTGAARNVA